MAKPVIVAVARDEFDATIWVDALRDAGIEATKYSAGVTGALGGTPGGPFARYAVLVDQGRIGDARNVIASLGGAGDLAPVSDGADKSSVALVWLGLGAVLAVMGMAALARVLAG